MTRFETIRDHLLEHGPQTSRQIADALGWPYNTASSYVSHARTYGYIEIDGRAPLSPTAKQHCPEYLYRPRSFLIRKPGQ